MVETILRVLTGSVIVSQGLSKYWDNCRPLVLGATVCSVLLATNVANADLLVSSLSIQNRALLSLSGAVHVDQIGFGSNSPVPISGIQTNSIGETYSHQRYSFDWLGDVGLFRVDGAHAAVNSSADFIQSLSKGSVNFTPMVDSVVTVHVRYDYALPDAFMEAVGSGGVSDDPAGITYVNLYVVDFSFEPTSGHYDQTMSAIVPAGCNCNFGYTMRLTTPGNSIPATDSGTVELSIAPLPEPAGLCLLVLGAIPGWRARPRYGTCAEGWWAGPTPDQSGWHGPPNGLAGAGRHGWR